MEGRYFFPSQRRARLSVKIRSCSEKEKDFCRNRWKTEGFTLWGSYQSRGGKLSDIPVSQFPDESLTVTLWKPSFCNIHEFNKPTESWPGRCLINTIWWQRLQNKTHKRILTWVVIHPNGPKLTVVHHTQYTVKGASKMTGRQWAPFSSLLKSFLVNQMDKYLSQISLSGQNSINFMAVPLLKCLLYHQGWGPIDSQAHKWANFSYTVHSEHWLVNFQKETKCKRE